VSASENQVILIGNLGRDPELREFPDGRRVALLNIATNREFKVRHRSQDGSVREEKREEVTWHRVSCFGRTAELVGQYLSKGRQVFVRGRLRQFEYTDRDGIHRWATEVVAERVLFLGSAPSGGARPPHPAEAPPPDADSYIPSDPVDDDMPF